jgi:putative ABC transport system permease protein
MRSIRQFLAILHLNLSGATRRLGSVITIIIGVACAVGVLVSMLAMGTGMMRQVMGNTRDDRVIVTSVGARNIESSIPRDAAVAVRDLPGIKKGIDDKPIVVFQTLVPMEARRRVSGTRLFFPLVGTTDTFTQYQPEFHMTGGRSFQRGVHELIASNACSRQFTGFEVGDRRSIRGVDWTIVGRFDEGQSQSCRVFADVETLMSAFNRNTYNVLGVMLQSPADFDVFRKALQANPSLRLEAQRERDERAADFKGLRGIMDFASYFVGAIMAIGATLGAVNCLYSIVDSRRREMGTLRAIGFGSGAITASILCESLLFALPGALLGCALAWALFNGLSASPFGISFQLAVTPSLGLIGILWALVIGLIGGLLPALRAARLPVATAIRAS